jgi:BirA family biotin operon repressor/biotin-[acetyl-CoA-carboxylase] ligase
MVPSTNDVARRLAQQGARDRTTVLAESYDAGRGRFGRSWFRGHANPYASVILRRETSPQAVPVFAFIASLALADAVTAERAPAAMRWPNESLSAGGGLYPRIGSCPTIRAAAQNPGYNSPPSIGSSG